VTCFRELILQQIFLEPAPWTTRELYGVRGLVRAFGRRLVAVECGKAFSSPGPLDAALLWRQVAKASKAVTSHRTPKSLLAGCNLALIPPTSP
jgi:hypothetical protein